MDIPPGAYAVRIIRRSVVTETSRSNRLLQLLKDVLTHGSILFDLGATVKREGYCPSTGASERNIPVVGPKEYEIVTIWKLPPGHALVDIVMVTNSKGETFTLDVPGRHHRPRNQLR